MEFEANAALSNNRIKDFDEVVETYDEWWENKTTTTVHYDNSILAFSPSAILNGFVNIKLGKITTTWHTGYVSRQYLDNTANNDRSLPAYSLSDLSFSYSMPGNKLFGHMTVGAEFNNVLNSRCATCGWVYSAILGNVHPEDNRYYQIGFIPTAPFSALAHITLKF